MLVLITGGLGYLGGRISDYLQKSNYQVRIATSRDEVDVPEELSGCEVVKINLLDSKSLESACDGVTAIIHLSAMNAQSCVRDPNQALLVNGLGTLNLLDAAIKKRVKKILYFSTAHIYASPLKGKIDERTLPKPIHPYSITHRLAEDYVIEANENNQIQGVVFRLSNAVGLPVNKNADCWSLVVNDLCRQIVTRNSMVIHSSGSVQRDFVSITDVCRAGLFFLQNNDKSLAGEIFNITNGASITLKELSKLLASRSNIVLDIKPEVNFKNESGKSNSEKLYSEKLIISNEKIKEKGFDISPNIHQELDNLICRCQAWFGK
jgi:UDP-glucose 4-epimerase